MVDGGFLIKELEGEEKILAYMGGLNGSGKSTIIKILEPEKEIKVFHGSKMLMEYLGCESYSGLDAIPEKDQIKARIAFFNSPLFSSHTQRIGLIDAHYIQLRGNSKFETSMEDEWTGRIDLFLHVVAKPKLILDRILKDPHDSQRKLQKFKSSTRDYEEEIEYYQEISVKVGAETARKLGRPFRIIDNNSAMEETIAQIKRILF